jgi:hypothetical protein
MKFVLVIRSATLGALRYRRSPAYAEREGGRIPVPVFKHRVRVKMYYEIYSTYPSGEASYAPRLVERNAASLLPAPNFSYGFPLTFNLFPARWRSLS